MCVENFNSLGSLCAYLQKSGNDDVSLEYDIANDAARIANDAARETQSAKRLSDTKCRTDASASGGIARGVSPLAGFFSSFCAKIVQFQSLFFNNFVTSHKKKYMI